MDKGLVDFGRGDIVPFPDLLEEMLALIEEDADHFQCRAQVEHARTIIARGTSAHWQLRTYREALESGADHDEAVRRIVDMLIEETLRDV